ncbi:nucleotidyltransferase family protein [Kineobactrum salinum]|uniref:Nucleotidyltransferase n=1 Tax=Kineobactrum salinum TaxID=2708301 RepID=A0A6C0U392_9GAMM|nr:nucleotidyltransferase domain-containing protein [Kineobactrum salinum]QIB66408.1 nucleotidyltransferase [Kineobactrum salinum]
MLLEELREHRSQIHALVSQFGGRRIRVFGSVARGDERPDSDIDFLVDFPRGYDLFAQRLPLTEKLGELLHRDVELLPEHELNPHIRDYVLKEAVEI